MWWGIATVGVGRRTRLVIEAVVTGTVGAGAVVAGAVGAGAVGTEAVVTGALEAGASAVVCRSELVLGLPLVHVMVLVVVLVLMLVLLSMDGAVVFRSELVHGMVLVVVLVVVLVLVIVLVLFLLRRTSVVWKRTGTGIRLGGGSAWSTISFQSSVPARYGERGRPPLLPMSSSF